MGEVRPCDSIVVDAGGYGPRIDADIQQQMVGEVPEIARQPRARLEPGKDVLQQGSEPLRKRLEGEVGDGDGHWNASHGIIKHDFMFFDWSYDDALT
jgi:hypothetical protein